jgi:hypothetical protein
MSYVNKLPIDGALFVQILNNINLHGLRKDAKRIDGGDEQYGVQYRQNDICKVN